jgi:histidinol phosphatase-like PHP family hydrolase
MNSACCQLAAQQGISLDLQSSSQAADYKSTVSKILSKGGGRLLEIGSAALKPSGCSVSPRPPEFRQRG